MASARPAAIAALMTMVVPIMTASSQPPAPAPRPQAPAAAAPSAESVKRAEQVLADARKALGGDKMAELKTLVASGRTRRVRGNNLVPIEFEILLELPAKYVRVDEFPAEDADPTSAGFNGDALIQIPAAAGCAGRPPAVRVRERAGRRGSGRRTSTAGAPPPSGATPPAGMPPPGGAAAGMMPPGAAGARPGGRGPAIDPRRARLINLKQDYARLALGLFAASSAYPLTFRGPRWPRRRRARADVLDVKGEDNFTLRYFIHSETRLPIMVTWNTPPTNVIVTAPGQPPPSTVAPGAVVVTGPPAPAKDAPKEEMDKYPKEVLALREKAQATSVEHRLYFADYRDVDGLKLPFRLRRAIGTETTEETTFDRFRVNTKIDQRKFEPIK